MSADIKLIAEQRRLHVFVSDSLREFLSAHARDRKILLSVSAVCRIFGVSRPPAERALKLLVNEGVLQLTIAGKFLRLPLQLSHNNERSISVEEVVQDLDQEGLNSPSRASWLALYDHVLQIVMSVIPFGSYRLVESAMAGYFGVSRSITNDVLARPSINRLARAAPSISEH